MTVLGLIESLHLNRLIFRNHLSRQHRQHSALYMTTVDDNNVESSLYRDIALLSTKALDTVEDAILHFRRTFLPSYTESATMEWMQNTSLKGPRHKPRVVIVGSGWAAHAFLKICETDGYEVVCVSPRPFFVFTPMLASTAVGTVEYRSIVEPIRQGRTLSYPIIPYINLPSPILLYPIICTLPYFIYPIQSTFMHHTHLLPTIFITQTIFNQSCFPSFFISTPAFLSLLFIFTLSIQPILQFFTLKQKLLIFHWRPRH